MSQTLPAILVAMCGAVMVVLSFSLPERRAGAPSGRWARKRRPLTRRQRTILAVSVGAGIVLGAVTGLWLLVVLIPLVTFGVPWMLRTGDEAGMSRLDALEAWTRGLAGLTVVGGGIEHILAASRDNCPDAIRAEVTRLVARINSRVTTTQALQLFADELDDETADLVVAQLILKADMRGSGLAKALEDLADSIQSEIRMRRQIETDRSGGRNELRIVTYMTVAVLVLILVARSYAAPYSTALGQVILAGYLLFDAAMLLLARKISQSKPGTRVLAVGEGKTR